MDDEVIWLRNAAPPTSGPGDLLRMHARRRVVEGVLSTQATRDEMALEALPMDGPAAVAVDEAASAPAASSRNRLVALGAAAVLALLLVVGSLLGGGDADDSDEPVRSPTVEADAGLPTRQP